MLIKNKYESRRIRPIQIAPAVKIKTLLQSFIDPLQ